MLGSFGFVGRGYSDHRAEDVAELFHALTVELHKEREARRLQEAVERAGEDLSKSLGRSPAPSDESLHAHPLDPRRVQVHPEVGVLPLLGLEAANLAHQDAHQSRGHPWTPTNGVGRMVPTCRHFWCLTDGEGQLSADFQGGNTGSNPVGGAQ